MKETILSISEAARQLQLETHVLRYWEDELDIKVPRNEMGHRIYRPREMKLLRTIMELKKQGFQLRAIKLVLHDLDEGEELDMEKLIAMREEINRRVEFLNEEGIEVEDSVQEIFQKSLIQKQLRSVSDTSNKIAKFQAGTDSKVTRLPVNGHGVSPKTVPVVANAEKTPESGLNQERVQQFQYIMLQIMNQSLKEHTEKLTAELKTSLAQELKQELGRQMSGDGAKQFGERLAATLDRNLRNHISDDVSTRIMKEMNYLARVQEEQEEAHYQKLDELLRQRQGKAKEKDGWKDRRQRRRDEKLVAAANEPTKKRHRKNKGSSL